MILPRNLFPLLLIYGHPWRGSGMGQFQQVKRAPQDSKNLASHHYRKMLLSKAGVLGMIVLQSACSFLTVPLACFTLHLWSSSSRIKIHLLPCGAHSPAGMCPCLSLRDSTAAKGHSHPLPLSTHRFPASCNNYGTSRREVLRCLCNTFLSGMEVIFIMTSCSCYCFNLI